MYKSKEIRWFVKNENETIVNWFFNQGITYSTITPRTDIYLPIPELDNMSIKLREGNIEIKQLHGKPLLHKFTENAIGYLEDWAKWSFNLKEADRLSNEIIKQKKYDWLEIDKKRLAIKIGLNEEGVLHTYPVKEKLAAGCQLEYSKLNIKDEVWFTFAAEWFGESFIKISKNYLSNVIGATVFNEKDSSGYNAFINKLIA